MAYPWKSDENSSIGLNKNFFFSFFFFVLEKHNICKLAFHLYNDFKVSENSKILELSQGFNFARLVALKPIAQDIYLFY